MTSAFTIAGEPIGVTQFTGFDLTDDVQSVGILSDGVSTHNSVLQQSAELMPTASVSGRTTDEEEIQLLRSLRREKAEVTFVEPLDGAHTVVVASLSITRSNPATFLFEWSVTLIETRAPGSGSGS